MKTLARKKIMIGCYYIITTTKRNLIENITRSMSLFLGITLSASFTNCGSIDSDKKEEYGR